MLEDNFSKYFVQDETEDFMGIHVTDIGYTHVPPNTKYPAQNHPSGYFFNWEIGRRLDEYQLVFIQRGQGTLELEKGQKLKVTAGSIFILYPNTWHRYKPSTSTGWDEYWIGFKDNATLPIFHNDLLNPKVPIHQIGVNNAIVRLFEDLIDTSKQQNSGFSASLAGGVFYLTGLLVNALKNHDFLSAKSGKKMQIAIDYLYQNVEKNIQIETIATEVGMSYSLFRKTFTSYTGISPNQYFLKLKMSKALNLLKYSELTVKEIAEKMGFETVQYFTRFVKEKTGESPRVVRLSVAGK